MALSGSFYTSWSNYVDSTRARFLFTWSGTQSIANNTTTISWNLKAEIDPSGNRRSIRKVVVNFDGADRYTQVYPYDNMLRVYTNTQLASGSYTVNHAEDGTKSITFDVKVNVGYANENTFNSTGSATYTLDTIPRASTITCASPVAMATTQTVTVTQKSADFSHILYYKTSAGSYTEIGRNTATHSYSWTLPDITSTIPNADSDTYTLRAVTYFTDDYTGDSIETLFNVTAQVPSSYVPTIQITSVTEANSNVPSNFPLLAGISKFTVTTTFTGSANSTCKSRTVQVPNNNAITSVTSTATQSVTFLNPINTTNATVSATTTDSRNRTGTASQSVTLYGYVAPTIELDCTRSDSAGNTDPVGDYINVRVRCSYDSVNSLNSATLVIKRNTTQVASVNLTGNITTWQSVVVTSASATQQWTIEGTITDLITSAIASQVVTKASMPFCRFDNGTDVGVDFGRLATEGGIHHHLDEHYYSDYEFNYHVGNTTNTFNNLKAFLLDTIYPVGSIYISTNSTSPATLFGGTWAQIQDTFLLASGSTYTAGNTGGNATLSWANMGINTTQGEASGQGTTTSNTFVNRVMVRYPSNGAPATGNNLPPYLVVNVWERTA